MVSPLPIEKSHKSTENQSENYPYSSTQFDLQSRERQKRSEQQNLISQRSKMNVDYLNQKQQYHEILQEKNGRSSKSSKSIGFVSGLRSMETTHKPITMLRSKVVIVGDATVGKTALVQAFVNNTFPKNYCMTPHIDFSVKALDVDQKFQEELDYQNKNIKNSNKTSVELYLYDCAGQAVFNQRQTNAVYYENASYIALVYDVTSKESFQSCTKWLQAVRASRPSNSTLIPGVLIASKKDLIECGRAVIPTSDGKEFAKANGLEFFETSSMTNEGVQDPFRFMVNDLYKRYVETVENASSFTIDAISQGMEKATVTASKNFY